MPARALAKDPSVNESRPHLHPWLKPALLWTGHLAATCEPVAITVDGVDLLELADALGTPLRVTSGDNGEATSMLRLRVCRVLAVDLAVPWATVRVDAPCHWLEGGSTFVRVGGCLTGQVLVVLTNGFVAATRRLDELPAVGQLLVTSWPGRGDGACSGTTSARGVLC